MRQARPVVCQRALSRALASGGLTPPARRAFTLVELLVVMALVVVLLGIAILVVPSVLDYERSSQGASMLQGWLMTAQQRAVLDRAPRGLRLLPGNAYPAGSPNPLLINQVQYIERPDDFTGGTVTTSTSNGVTTVTFQGVDLSGGQGQGSNQSLWPVQAGDYFEVQGGGLMHVISSVGFNVQSNSWFVVLGSAVPNDIATPTSNYRIERAPRLLGDEPMSLPNNIAIDLTTNGKQYGPGGTSSPPPAGPTDILFSPKGELLSTSSGVPLVLWVHDITQSDEFQASPSLVAIFPRSGKIASYDINPDSSTTGPNGLPYPYAFVGY